MKKNRNILIKNIYYMLSYAFTILNQGEYEKLGREEFEHVHNLFAAILTQGISKQIKQGLYREYINKRESLSIVHGKIDIDETMKNQLARKKVVVCEYDDLSENNLLNRILKSTAVLLLQHPEVDRKYKNALKKELLFFADVQLLNLSKISWKRLQFQRNNRSYQMLISLCQLIVEGMLLTTEEGRQKLATFIDDQQMSRLYEKFILEYYRREFPGIHVNAAQIPWAVDDGHSAMLPIMQSDITLQKGNRVLIIEAKYYGQNTQVRYDKHTIHSANLYQLFTYVKNRDAAFGKEARQVSGLLLYARTDADIQPHHCYVMGGNEISVQTLDLNQKFGEIAKQLNNIAKIYFEYEKTS